MSEDTGRPWLPAGDGPGVRIIPEPPEAGPLPEPVEGLAGRCFTCRNRADWIRSEAVPWESPMQKTVQSIERVFDILELLSHEPNGLNLTKVGTSLGLHKSTVHRLLKVLKKRGYIEKEDESGRYRLGPGFVELASLLLNSVELKTEAEPFLRRLSQITGQTVFLATLQDREAVYLDKVEQFNSLRKYSVIGQRRPLYCTSLGKALIMNRSKEELKELFKDASFRKYTPNTHGSLTALLKDLEICRKRGWAADDEEFEPETRCISAPITDYRGTVVAAVSAVWSTFNTSITFSGMKPHVLEAARGISRRLGHADTPKTRRP
jgi:IclR family KDG regulon transcriptional repressor